MDEKDAQEYLIRISRNVPIMRTMGITLEYNEDGEAVFRMPRNPDFHHGMGDTHGGVFATLLDSAGWFTVAAKCGKFVLTSDLHVRMLQGAKNQDLVATGKLIRSGSKIAVAEMTLCSADGELIAVGTGSFAIMGELGERAAQASARAG
jgi:uncharacterized protein (TIGR00369 family)